MEHISSALARAFNAAPINGEARITETTVPSPKNLQTQSDFASGDDVVKGKTNIAAELAQCRYCLHALSNGTWMFSKRDLSKSAAALQAAAAFLDQGKGAT